MNLKWIGVILIISSCGGLGFSIAADHRRTEQMLRQLVSAFNLMEWEVTYRLTSLPELYRKASESLRGRLKTIFLNLAEELETQMTADADSCMEEILAREKNLPDSIRQILKELGASMGHFDLPGQVQGLQSLRNVCHRELEKMEDNREPRLRSYQALGVCTGAALAILFL